ncbi:MAG: TMEM165/GDT1 family protein [Chromatiaceae bacterium]|nr:TMEM165/GDT1 family protein [Chromatiaceae bacterium]MCF7997257.1 TMEM165/GDT1 family protein [Chromatiaceae bacterium]MCF8005502.1 TMEM165/GDT1 family protein [Chromatiaceae bacterium]MCF8014716.1 TMEM165/GDT1 family protein [Chromatiaceae bacterium]
MDISVALSTFALLFLAEMGDKSQLLVMTLAHRYRPGPVIAGSFVAFALLNLLAVVVGQALFDWLPQGWLLLVAAGLFLFFGVRSWQDANQGEDDAEIPARNSGGFLQSFSLIFVAELGDKTQLAMLALAASTGDLWAVLFGGTLALWSVSLIGILFGCTLLRRLPTHWVHRAAAILFIGFGLLALGQLLFNGVVVIG